METRTPADDTFLPKMPPVGSASFVLVEKYHLADPHVDNHFLKKKCHNAKFLAAHLTDLQKRGAISGGLDEPNSTFRLASLNVTFYSLCL